MELVFGCLKETLNAFNKHILSLQSSYDFVCFWSTLINRLIGVMQLSRWGDLGKRKSLFECILNKLQEISVFACYYPHTIELCKTDHTL